MDHRVYTFDDFELDSANRILRRNGEPVPLAAKAFDVLHLLVERRGNLVSKDDLLLRVWDGQSVEESNLTVQISQIRKALQDNPRAPRLIETVPGFGYRLTANGAAAGIVETSESVRITIEHEETRTSYSPTLLFAAGAFAAVALIASAAAFFGFFGSRKEPAATDRPFYPQRLTNNGRVGTSAVSRDGRLTAYTMAGADGTAIWVRQTGTANDLRIIQPVTAEIWSLAFDPSGARVYYVSFSSGKVDPELWSVPALGGVPVLTPEVYAHSISFAPDGQRFAYVLPNSAANENHLIVQNTDGSGKRTVATKPQPETFVFDGDLVAWAPDGGSIAAVVNSFEPEANFGSIRVFDPESGAERVLSSGKWFNILSIAWTSDSFNLLVSASEAPGAPNRVWRVPRNGDDPTAITGDLHAYDSLSAGGPGDSFSARRTEVVGSLLIGETDGEFKEIVSELGSLAPARWTGSGKVVFRSFADGSANLWIADGTAKRQLTVGANVDERGLCVTPDERSVVFVSWQSGRSNLWRVGLYGRGMTRLTDGEADAFPVCSPDGKSVFFQRGLLSQPALWRVPVEGGTAERVTRHRAKWGSLSPDGRTLAFFRMQDERWQIGFADANGELRESYVDVPDLLRGSRTAWSEDGRWIYFAGAEGEAVNLWKMPVGGGGPTRLTDFGPGSVSDFDTTPEGRFVVSRSRQLSDIVRFER